MGMTAFDELAAAINREWKTTSYDNRRLPEIASRALAEHRILERVAHEDVATWFMEAESLPAQPNLSSDFGQPPVTVYADHRFYIEVLTWLENTTSIHQHGFSGAFQVLAGSSLHSVYSFAETSRVHHRLLFGQLTLDKVERLQVGDVHPIHAGSAYIHGLFHLGYPSATIVVRTFVEADQTPQYHFLPPSVAIDDFYSNVVLQRQIEMIQMLSRIESPALDSQLAAWLERADLESGFRLLLRSAKRGAVSGARLESAFAAFEARFPEAAPHLRAAILEEARTRRLMAMRPHITDPAHRLLLALMIAAPGREQAMAVIEEAYPGEAPAKRVLQWIAEINVAAPTPLSFRDVQMLVGAPVPAPTA